jgi:hypothetical protein
VTPAPQAPRLWRVGYHADPLGFAPRELYEYSHRFDDLRQRFRTHYLAEQPQTCLREVLADFRPNLEARRRHLERFGPEAAEDFPAAPVTAAWRTQNVLVLTALDLDGPLIDLTDPSVRQSVEQQQMGLLADHGLDHLDLHEITTARRAVTQTIASDLYNNGAAAVRFPSRIDGLACVALFEGRRCARARRRTGGADRPASHPARRGRRGVGPGAGAGAVTLTPRRPTLSRGVRAADLVLGDEPRLEQLRNLCRRQDVRTRHRARDQFRAAQFSRGTAEHTRSVSAPR